MYTAAPKSLKDSFSNGGYQEVSISTRGPLGGDIEEWFWRKHLREVVLEDEASGTSSTGASSGRKERHLK